LDPIDLQDCIDRYAERFRRHGDSPETLGWGKNARQDVRFSVLAGPALGDPDSSVLDIGCGFGDLFDYLTARGWRGRYTGVDIVPDLLRVARERHPDLDFIEADVSGSSNGLPSADCVIASGVFNAKLKTGDNSVHIQRSLANMAALARRAVCADFMTDRVDFQQPGSWHTNPEWALGIALKLSRRVRMRMDYMPYEFAIIIFSDATVSERNVFAAYEAELAARKDASRP
jgi:SAM-dependent methyltransferase